MSTTADRLAALEQALEAPVQRVATAVDAITREVDTIKRLIQAPGPLNKKLRRQARKRRRALKAKAERLGHVVR